MASDSKKRFPIPALQNTGFMVPGPLCIKFGTYSYFKNNKRHTCILFKERERDAF